MYIVKGENQYGANDVFAICETEIQAQDAKLLWGYRGKGKNMRIEECTPAYAEKISKTRRISITRVSVPDAEEIEMERKIAELEKKLGVKL